MHSCVLGRKGWESFVEILLLVKLGKQGRGGGGVTMDGFLGRESSSCRDRVCAPWLEPGFSGHKNSAR